MAHAPRLCGLAATVLVRSASPKEGFVHWFLSAIGGLFCLLAAAMAVLELLVERQKRAEDRNWPETWDRIRCDAGGLAIGGLLMFPLAIFMVEPVAGFRLFL